MHIPQAPGAPTPFMSLRRRALAPLAWLRASRAGAVAPAGPAARSLSFHTFVGCRGTVLDGAGGIGAICARRARGSGRHEAHRRAVRDPGPRGLSLPAGALLGRGGGGAVRRAAGRLRAQGPRDRARAGQRRRAHRLRRPHLQRRLLAALAPPALGGAGHAGARRAGLHPTSSRSTPRPPSTATSGSGTRTTAPGRATT